VTATYQERLRQLAVSEAGPPDAPGGGDAARDHLDPKTLALVELAALIAVGGADPSFGEHVDAAVSAGADANEIVAVLVGVRHVVGAPRVVAAAPKIALALGYDLDEMDL